MPDKDSITQMQHSLSTQMLHNQKELVCNCQKDIAWQHPPHGITDEISLPEHIICSAISAYYYIILLYSVASLSTQGNGDDRSKHLNDKLANKVQHSRGFGIEGNG